MNGNALARGGALFQQGLALHQQSRLDEARLLYEQVLQMHPDHAPALHLSGLIALHSGLFASAAEQIGKAALIDVNNAEVHADCGRAQLQLRQYSAALASFERAISIRPQYAQAHHFRGTVLLSLGRHRDCVDSYEKAIALKYETAGGLYNLGTALYALEEYEAAVASFDRALALKPDHVEAHNNRGLALSELGRHAAALASYERSIALEPDHGNAHNNRGLALCELGQYEAAVASYEAAIAVGGGHAMAYNNRGNALYALGRYDAAIESYERAIALQPNLEKAYTNLGELLQELRRWDAALASYDRAIAVNPDCAAAHHDRGDALLQLKHYAAAIASYDRAFALEPDRAFLPGTRQFARLQICDWTDLEPEIDRLAAGVEQRRPIAPPFQALALFGSAALQRQAAQTWVRETIRPRLVLPAVSRRDAGGKIRLGYFSGDFRDHPVSILTAELFELHDRERFEVVAFSFRRDLKDALRERLQSAFDRFIDVSGRPDHEIALLARSLGIDIAVDLGGFTQGGKARMFALRAAPLQVGFLGFSGTMGPGFMDYLIADRTVVPDDARGHYDEKIISLPDCYLPNDSTRRITDSLPSRADLGLPPSGFVYCCFNNTYKITPDRFDAWMRILKRVEGSVLWLSEGNAAAAGNLRKEAARRNVDPERLIFAKRLPSQADHLARHRAADLFIDTLPYNAHSTAADALWAGLPIVTLIGDAFAGRVAASLLGAVGLPELVTSTDEQYEDLAVALARDPTRLAQIRQTLAANRLSSALFDTRRYARHLESAYAAIQQRYLQELPAESIQIPRA